jgi:pimeloyl-ACP methyl ester carboxylesterase
VVVDGIGLNVLQHVEPAHAAGSGSRPLLFLHGGMAHARWWDLVAPALAQAGSGYALDRRGHGDSDWTTANAYGWERDLLDAEAVISALDGYDRPWTIVGHSQGGLQAVHLARRARVPIEALVLVEAPLHPVSPRLSRAGNHFAKIRQPRYSSLDSAIDTFRPFPAAHTIAPDVVRYIASHSYKPTEDGTFTSKFHWRVFQGTREARANPLADFAAQIAALDVPTLVVRGSDSSILLADEAAAFVSALRRGRAVEVAGATHNPHLEQPAAVVQAIAEFIASL